MTTTPNRIGLHRIGLDRIGLDRIGLLCTEFHCDDSGFHVFDRTA